MKDFMKAWSVSEKDFPHEGSDGEKLAFCLRYAILAPSPYNTQPWFFKIEDNICKVYADRRYALPVIDPDDRELVLSCAAAIYSLRLAIRSFGYSETTEIKPDENDADLLARVKFGRKLEMIDERDRLLFKAIPKRHMNRTPFSERQVPEEIVENLKAVAKQEKAWLHICSEAEKQIVVRMVAEADQMQTSNKHFRRELASWLDQRRHLSGDGMPYLGLDYATIMDRLSPSVARRFENHERKVANDDDIALHAPVIAVLGTKSGVDLERIYAGQALMKVFLQAECDGVAASTLNQPCEVPELRLRLHDELELQGRAHIILRFGYGDKPQYSPRRPLSQSLEFSGKQTGALEQDIERSSGNKRPVFGKFRNLFLAKK